MESSNTTYNTINSNTNNNNTNDNNSESNFKKLNKEHFENDNIVIPSNFLISTKDIIARFPHNKRVGNYLLGRKLGEGSFAKVKEGLHTLTGQKVAIKVIDKKKAKEDAYVSKNMRREGKLLQMIIHPNIIQLYELMETENSYYLVAELCEGGDLMDYICNRKYLSEVCTRKFIRQIISAVDYLHRIGILHRDLKIENLLLDRNHNIKIIDFGLSNYTKNELCITQCGSPAYAAPELLAHKRYGSKVDVWSIGVNMYAMLTGNLPFTVEPFNIKALYNKMMKSDMNPIPDHLSKSGEDLLKKLLNPDPSKRICLKDAMDHNWINEGYQNTLKAYVYPNRPTEEQLNPTILKYMSNNMHFVTNDVTENIKANKASSSLATYYLLLNKVKTMMMKMEPKKEKLKSRTDTKNIKESKIKEFRSNKNLNTQPSTSKNNKTIEESPLTSINTSSSLKVHSKLDAEKPAPKTMEQVINQRQATIENKLFLYSNNSNNNNTNQAIYISGAIKNLTHKYNTMHIGHVENKTNDSKNNTFIKANTMENKKVLPNLHNSSDNDNSSNINDKEFNINSNNNNNNNRNQIEWTQLIRLNFNRTTSDSNNLGELNDMNLLKTKEYSNSSILHAPNTSKNHSVSPSIAMSPVSIISSPVSHNYTTLLTEPNQNANGVNNKINFNTDTQHLSNNGVHQKGSPVVLPIIEPVNQTFNQIMK